MKTAFLIGSSRSEGNTAQLLRLVADRFTSSTILNLNEYEISVYDYEHANRHDDFLPLVERLIQFDHIVFVTPVYWYAMSAQLKIFFDRFSDLLTIEKDLGRRLRGINCSVISTGSWEYPPSCFEEVFKLTFKYLGMNYQGLLYCPVENEVVPSNTVPSINKYMEQIHA